MIDKIRQIGILEIHSKIGLVQMGITHDSMTRIELGSAFDMQEANERIRLLEYSDGNTDKVSFYFILVQRSIKCILG